MACRRTSFTFAGGRVKLPAKPLILRKCIHLQTSGGLGGGGDGGGGKGEGDGGGRGGAYTITVVAMGEVLPVNSRPSAPPRVERSRLTSICSLTNSTSSIRMCVSMMVLPAVAVTVMSSIVTRRSSTCTMPSRYSNSSNSSSCMSEKTWKLAPERTSLPGASGDGGGGDGVDSWVAAQMDSPMTAASTTRSNDTTAPLRQVRNSRSGGGGGGGRGSDAGSVPIAREKVGPPPRLDSA